MKLILILLLIIPTVLNAQGVSVPTKVEFDAQGSNTNTEINLLKARVAKLESQVAALTTEVATLKTSVATLDSSTKASIATLDNQVAALTLEISSLRDRVTKLEGGNPSTCTYAFDFPVYNYSAAGGVAREKLITAVECPWTVISDSTWIQLTSHVNGANGKGPAEFIATIHANTGVARQGTIKAGTATFLATQDGTTAPPVLTYVDPPSNELCYTSTQSEGKLMQWDTDGPGPAVTGYHVLVGSKSNTYDLPLMSVGTSNQASYSFMGVETRCFIVKGYVMQ